MTRGRIEEILARRLEAWGRRDAEALAADHAENGVLRSPVGGDVKGRSAILNIYRGWFSSFPDVEFLPEHVVISRDQAAQFAKIVGVQRGEFCGFAPTGKRFEIYCALLFDFADDKITREIRVYDFAGLLLQLGVLQAKPAF